MLLADLGARVIKIEEAETGDETRHWGPPFAGGESAYYLSLNRNKESVELNLKLERDRVVFHRLIEQSDVLVQNFRPGVTERLGIDYESVRSRNRRLVYASISGFGQTGPDRERPGYDLIVQAMSGMMLASGSDGAPAKACFPVADVLAGQFACQAILAALFERQRTDEGTHVEVSLLESLLSAMSFHATACLMTGRSPVPQGTNNSSIVPYQLLRCQDKPLAVGVPNERIWRRFCAALGKPEWSDDERYRSNELRIRNRATLIADVESVMVQRSSAEWLSVLDESDVPCGPLLSVAEIFEHPQVLARGNVIEVDHPAAGTVKMVANPMRFAGRDIEYRSPPVLGQHTVKVFEEFGLSETSESVGNRIPRGL